MIAAPVEKVWECFTDPEHVVQWNTASEDWHTTHAENNPMVGGTFRYRMEAKDGSTGFDFEGAYTAIIPHERIAYSMSDGREVDVLFRAHEGQTHVSETFDPEQQNPLQVQKDGWQAILNNFKRYVESR